MPQRGLMIHGILVIAVRAWDWRLNLLNIFHVVLRGHTTQWATKPLVYTVEWDNAEDKAPVKLFGSLSNALDPTTYYGNDCPLTTTRMDPPFSRCWSYTTIAGKKRLKVWPKCWNFWCGFGLKLWETDPGPELTEVGVVLGLDMKLRSYEWWIFWGKASQRTEIKWLKILAWIKAQRNKNETGAK